MGFLRESTNVQFNYQPLVIPAWKYELNQTDELSKEPNLSRTSQTVIFARLKSGTVELGNISGRAQNVTA